MAEDSRNFRSYYYGKVGCRGVEEKKSLELLLNDNPLDASKISQFCLRFPVPAMYRIQVWKILLDIEAKSLTCKDFVSNEKKEHFEILKQALVNMKKVSNDTSRSLLFMYMHFLEEGVLLTDMEDNDATETVLAITSAYAEMIEEDFDAFWLARNFYKSLKKQKAHILFMLGKIGSILKKEDAELFEHVSQMEVLQELPLESWMIRAFAGILPASCLERLWDKVIGGSSCILAFIIVSMFLSLKRKIMAMENSDDLSKVLTQLSEESAEVLVCQAIDLWQKYSNLYSDSKLKF